MRIDKTLMVNGAGATVGLVQTVFTKEYLTGIPYIDTIIPYPWNQWNSLGNILIGGTAFILSQFTNLIRNNNLNAFLSMYGITALIGGIMNGLFPIAPAASAGGNGYYTSTYYPYFRGSFYNRPASRAQGFASDVTRNPMAAIPTTIPYNKVLF